jgi:uncharacterized protein
MPESLSLWSYALLFGAAFIGGGINALAGGGTMLVFPALLSTGHTLSVANVTSTIALGSGQLTTMLARWRETFALGKGMLGLMGMGFLGSAMGVYLFLHTSESIFKKIVPFLLLFATLLFLFQDKIAPKKTLEKTLKKDSGEPDTSPETFSLRPPLWFPLLCISLYGGYFGAGMGIMTLATLGILGERDLLRMTTIKNAFTSSVTFIATVLFVFSGKIAWPSALVMIVGAMLGGYIGVGVAQKIGKQNLRRIVITVGFVLSSILFYKQFS